MYQVVVPPNQIFEKQTVVVRNMFRFHFDIRAIRMIGGKSFAQRLEHFQYWYANDIERMGAGSSVFQRSKTGRLAPCRQILKRNSKNALVGQRRRAC